MKKGECPYAVSFDPEILKRVALEMLCEAGVDLMFHATFSDALTEGRNVQAILIENKSGRQAVQGQIYVDATGDGDLAARAGARYEKVEKEGQRMMRMTLMYRVAGIPKPAGNERRLWVNNLTTRWGPSVGGLDGSDAADLTQAEIKVRLAVEEHVQKLRESFPEAALLQPASVIGVRATLRIVGHYTITEEDALSSCAQLDSVAGRSTPVTTHYCKRRFFCHLGFAVPYGRLVPADLANVLLAGRCISASQPAFQSARSMAPNMAISQATGTAAAMCVKTNCRPADLDVRALQQQLEADGAGTRIPPEDRRRGMSERGAQPG